MTRDESVLYVCVIVVLAVTVALAVGSEPTGVLSGFLAIQASPARLVTDFSARFSPGAALLNAAVTAGAALALVRALRIRLSGPTIAAIFTIFGFAMFGKTVVNAVPIVLGVALAARFARKRLADYLLIALFGTALGPVVSFAVAELPLPLTAALPIAAAAGIAIGFLLPPLAIAMLRTHQGYTLYNIGVTSGMLALFIAATIIATAGRPDPIADWRTAPSAPLSALPLIAAAIFAAFALYLDRGALGRSLALIWKLPGRLPSDFMEMGSVGGGLANMAILSLMAWGYVWIVGAPMNGAVLSGVFTIVGFGAFGKHPRNVVWPVLGVVAAAFATGVALNAPAVILAALFVTTLAPLAGEFGAVAGVLAGATHLVLVQQTGAWHAGFTLYNNGLAGGLVALLFVAVIEWVQGSREQFTVRRRS